MSTHTFYIGSLISNNGLKASSSILCSIAKKENAFDLFLKNAEDGFQPSQVNWTKYENIYEFPVKLSKQEDRSFNAKYYIFVGEAIPHAPSALRAHSTEQIVHFAVIAGSLEECNNLLLNEGYVRRPFVKMQGSSAGPIESTLPIYHYTFNQEKQALVPKLYKSRILELVIPDYTTKQINITQKLLPTDGEGTKFKVDYKLLVLEDL